MYFENSTAGISEIIQRAEKGLFLNADYFRRFLSH